MPLVGTSQRVQNGVRPVSSPLSLAAPVSGWNTRDEVDSMGPLDAITLDNFYPDSYGVAVRNGFATWATGMGTDAVETLAEYRTGSADKLLAACGDSIFDVTSAGAVGAAIHTGYTSARWQTTNFLGQMFLANGADTLQVYNGSTLADSTFTGVTLSTLIGVYQYQQRLFFWQSPSTGFWYAPLNSITGALAFYDLAQFTPQGGVLVGMTSVTHDGGNGVLDFAAFLMSSGDMLLFFGNDPSQASAWQMIGRYRISPPINIRSVCSYGAEAYVATFDDYVPLQQQLVALKVGTMPPRSKISGAVQQAFAINPGGFGWQALYYPKGRRLIFNVPNGDGTFYQHVCNTALPTNPWCRFKGMNAFCWGLLGNTLYFGGYAGIVYEADVNSDDNGAVIQASAQQAWNKADNAYRKRMCAVRPIVQSTQGNYNFSVGFDYASPSVSSPPALAGAAITDDDGFAITDDNGLDITVGVPGITPSWFVSSGTGTAFSFGMSVNSIGTTNWLRTDYRMEGGDAL